MGLSYAYANARIKGMESNLLDENVFRELMQVKTIDEITAILEQTPYKQDLVEASKKYSGVQVIDVALHNNYARTLAVVSRILPKHGKKLFSLYDADYDAHNLRLILSRKALGLDVKRDDLVLSGDAHAELCEKLLSMKNVGDAVAFIASKWGSKEFKEAMERLGASAKSRKPIDFKMAIKEIELERVRQLMSLARSADALTRRIIEQELLLESVMVVLRLKRDRVANAGDYVVYRNKFVEKLLQLDFEDCVKKVTDAFKLEADVAAKARSSLSLLEIALERKAVEKILRWTKLSVLSFATVVGFLYLKNVEVSNLRKIAYANAYDLKRELSEYVFAVHA